MKFKKGEFKQLTATTGVGKSLILGQMNEQHVKNFAKVWNEAMETSHPAIIVPADETKVVFIGNVWEREIDNDMGCEFVAEVSDDQRNRFSELLDDYIGSKVKITIERIGDIDV